MTDSERFDLACLIFEQVRELDNHQQEERLRKLCSGDEDLQSEVQSMLSMHQSGSPLDQPSHMPSIDALVTMDRLNSAPQIDRYEIGDRIGEGGMGEVYAAEMLNPRRPVAIKVIRLGMSSERVLERFDLERQAIARMEHPNIASILDAGVTSDGRPYFAMELARGQTIVQQLNGSKVDTKARIELIIQVCYAIQHAHQRGIIHRDIKPSNIIVTQTDGKMIPKVIDFGIAKATRDHPEMDATMTAHAQAIGTPAYMSPEQADLSMGDVDTRTDVYSLGVVLYEMLTGSTPLVKEELTQKSYAEMLESIRDQDPQRPSARLATTQLDRDQPVAVVPEQLKGDLDWIVMKCLEKDPNRRYETVSAFAEDLTRYLNNEPVLARPASRSYLTRKFIRRHRGSVIASSVVLGVLLLGIAGTSYGLVWALNEKERAEVLAQSELEAQIQAREASERALLEAQTAEDLSEFFIMDVLSSVDPSRAESRDITVREALVNAAENVDGKFNDRPDVESRIHNALGFLFNQLGSPELAQRHHMREWEIAEQENGELSIDAARMMHSVVGSLARQGRDSEAIELTQRQLRVLDELGTPEADALRPRAVGNLGALMVRSGRYEEAAPILEETLILKKEIYGDQHPTTLSTLNNLASVLSDLGEHERAILLGKQAYEGRKSVLGENDPRTFVSLLNYASALSQTGRFDESLPMLKEGFKQTTSVLGEDHPTSIDVANTYAKSLYESGNLNESEIVSRASVRVQSRLDPEMIQERTLSAYSLLASTLNNKDMNEEALNYSSAIINSFSNNKSASKQNFIPYKRLHGQILTGLKRYEQAEVILLEAWELTTISSTHTKERDSVRSSILMLYESWAVTLENDSLAHQIERWKVMD
ncbi:MAG: tetratricopeptide repeat protein [Phycisphaerales bacterium]